MSTKMVQHLKNKEICTFQICIFRVSHNISGGTSLPVEMVEEDEGRGAIQVRVRVDPASEEEEEEQLATGPFCGRVAFKY